MPLNQVTQECCFRQAFDCLKDNNKTQINLMTILAEDYYLFSKEIVDIVVERIYTVSDIFFLFSFLFFCFLHLWPVALLTFANKQNHQNFLCLFKLCSV